MQYTTTERLKLGKKIISSRESIFFKRLIHPVLLLASGTKVKYKIEKQYDEKKIDEYLKCGKTLIFVCNHSNSSDSPIAFKMIKKHAVLFAGKQPLNFEDELFFNLNDTIFVDRKDKNDMAFSKKAMIATLKEGRNLLVFPEGTWNVDDATLMIPTKWGIIDVARETNSLIIPMSLDYDYDDMICRCNFGNAIDVLLMNNLDGINMLRDEIATMLWNSSEKKDKLVRRTMNMEDERKKFLHRIEEYPKLDYEYEKSIVYKPIPSPDEVFEPLKKLSKK